MKLIKIKEYEIIIIKMIDLAAIIEYNKNLNLNVLKAIIQGP